MKVYFYCLFALCLSSPSFALDCQQAYTTIEVNQCAQQELLSAEKKMQRYLAQSIAQFRDDSLVAESIEQAQHAWLAYRKTHCDSVYNQWRGGTIRTVMAIACETKLTQQRTRELWLNYLTFMDSTPPILPEP